MRKLQLKPAAPSPVIAYGTPINLESAKKIITGAEAFAVSKQYTVAIAIVDNGGNLVAFVKMDNTQIGSIDVALGKARTANNFKRPSKAFEETVTNGGASCIGFTRLSYRRRGAYFFNGRKNYWSDWRFRYDFRSGCGGSESCFGKL